MVLLQMKALFIKLTDSIIFIKFLVKYMLACDIKFIRKTGKHVLVALICKGLIFYEIKYQDFYRNQYCIRSNFENHSWDYAQKMMFRLCPEPVKYHPKSLLNEKTILLIDLLM